MQNNAADTINPAGIGQAGSQRSGIYLPAPIASASTCIYDDDQGTFQDVTVTPDFAAYDIDTNTDSEQNVVQYACSVMAILNMASYVHSHYLINAYYAGSPWRTFHFIWDLTSTTVNHVSNGYQYDTTFVSKQKEAIQTYFNNYTAYECSVDEFVLIRNFNVFVQNINDEHPVFLIILIRKPTGQLTAILIL